MPHDQPAHDLYQEICRIPLLDPHSQRIWMYRGGDFHPYEPRAASLPAAPTSLDWYRGWRDFLEFAVIGANHGPPPTGDESALRPPPLRGKA